eukprot:TRINITY_DN3467_c0_g1_i1.p1 TRINITY_DN3467_c0_g1~~TRINITY_DN3467_c0_g1_i1.p1  ORF type:complete len:399 (+),score=88.04 TRINITY_DN3467_c0_g1_i1:28-1224(+)
MSSFRPTYNKPKAQTLSFRPATGRPKYGDKSKQQQLVFTSTPAKPYAPRHDLKQKQYKREFLLKQRSPAGLPPQSTIDVLRSGSLWSEKKSNHSPYHSKNQSSHSPSHSHGQSHSAERPRRFFGGMNSVQVQFQGLLNKLTEQNFSSLSKKIIVILKPIKVEEELKPLVTIAYKKALVEQKFNRLYGALFMTINEQVPALSSTNHSFRSMLLNQCQEEFVESLQPVLEKDLKDDEERAKLNARGDGIVNLLGELLRRKLVSMKIVTYCTDLLVKKIRETLSANVVNEKVTATLESCGSKLARFLGHMGALVDVERVTYKDQLDATMNVASEFSKMEAIPHRIRFMLMNVIDARKSGWTKKIGETETIADLEARAIVTESPEKGAQDAGVRKVVRRVIS